MPCVSAEEIVQGQGLRRHWSAGHEHAGALPHILLRSLGVPPRRHERQGRQRRVSKIQVQNTSVHCFVQNMFDSVTTSGSWQNSHNSCMVTTR